MLSLPLPASAAVAPATGGVGCRCRHHRSGCCCRNHQRWCRCDRLPRDISQSSAPWCSTVPRPGMPLIVSFWRAGRVGVDAGGGAAGTHQSDRCCLLDAPDGTQRNPVKVSLPALPFADRAAFTPRDYLPQAGGSRSCRYLSQRWQRVSTPALAGMTSLPPIAAQDVALAMRL